jgi:hypothetical protein
MSQQALYNLIQLEPFETRTDPLFMDFLNKYQFYVESRQRYVNLHDWRRPEENDMIKYLERNPHEINVYTPKIESIQNERKAKVEAFENAIFNMAVDNVVESQYLKNRKINKDGLKYELKYQIKGV